MTVFFVADTHFGHGNILHLCNRPFATIKEHDDTLIANWNNCVKSSDMVYHIGDFAMCPPGYAQSILNSLNGSIHLILGNHDKTAQQIQKSKKGKKFSSVRDIAYIGVEGQKIMLCHYAMRTWRSSYRGSYHIFGHSHGRMPPFGKSFDAGVDCWGYSPISFETVKNKMAELEYLPFGDEDND